MNKYFKDFGTWGPLKLKNKIDQLICQQIIKFSKAQLLVTPSYCLFKHRLLKTIPHALELF